MKIAEITKIEDDNFDKIILIKEGIFYRAYERSAWFFSIQIKRFKLVKKRYKNIADREVIYLGFPVVEADSILKEEQKILDSKERIILKSTTFFDEQKFLQWKDSIELNESEHVPIKSKNNIENLLAQKIADFNALNSSPFDCLRFVLELKSIVGQDI